MSRGWIIYIIALFVLAAIGDALSGPESDGVYCLGYVMLVVLGPIAVCALMAWLQDKWEQ